MQYRTKVKEGIDLKELEKYGFTKYHQHMDNNNFYYRRKFLDSRKEFIVVMNDSRHIIIAEQSIIILDDETSKVSWQFKRFCVTKCVEDLINAGIVEKCRVGCPIIGGKF